MSEGRISRLGNLREKCKDLSLKELQIPSLKFDPVGPYKRLTTRQVRRDTIPPLLRLTVYGTPQQGNMGTGSS